MVMSSVSKLQQEGGGRTLGLGRNDDARSRFVSPHNHLGTQLPHRDISVTEVVLAAMDLP
jgi:hypothetical protein